MAPSSRAAVLITGASSGIGRAAARLFAERGAVVFGTSRHPGDDAAGVEMLPLDVRSEDSVRHCIDLVTAGSAHIDTLINNAGVMHQGFAEETSVAAGQELFDTNFFGTVRVTRAVLLGMRPQSGADHQRRLACCLDRRTRGGVLCRIQSRSGPLHRGSPL